MKTTFVMLVVSLLAAASAQAKRLKGFIWEASASSIVVEGETVRLAPETKIELPNHEGITARDLRIGWEVEVETRGEGAGQVARKLRVMNARFQEEDVEGVVDGVNHVRFFVDGDEIRLKKGAVPPGLKPGMRFKGKGIRQDDRSIELKEGQVMPVDFVGEEARSHTPPTATATVATSPSRRSSRCSASAASWPASLWGRRPTVPPRRS
jgi:hypothetical protein